MLSEDDIVGGIIQLLFTILFLGSLSSHFILRYDLSAGKSCIVAFSLKNKKQSVYNSDNFKSSVSNTGSGICNGSSLKTDVRPQRV